MPAKLLYLDLETTGTDPKIHGIVQLGALLEVDGAIVDRIETLVSPWPGAAWSPEAVEKTGIGPEKVAGAPSESAAWAMFTAFLGRHISRFNKQDKAFLVGYNVGFDDQFLRAWADRVGDAFLGAYKWPDVIDVRGLAALRLMSVRGAMPNFQLGTVAATVLGRDLVDALLGGRAMHDAMADIELTRELFLRLAWGDF